MREGILAGLPGWTINDGNVFSLCLYTLIVYPYCLENLDKIKQKYFEMFTTSTKDLSYEQIIHTPNRRKWRKNLCSNIFFFPLLN